MPRTTTSRFNPLPAILALALLLPAVASAQEAQPSTKTHTVVRHDTLWDLARKYLNDPFLWPQIYRLNTDVVEDPHWIYPGEVLRLAEPPEGIQAVPSQDTPPPPAPGDSAAAAAAAAAEEEMELAYPMPEFARRHRRESLEGLLNVSERPYAPLRAGEFYSAGFLTEDRQLPYGIMLGTVTPQQIRNLSERAAVTLFSHVAVRAPSDGSYGVNDSLLVIVRETGFPGYGEIVVPTGMIRITGQAENQYLGEVVAVYGAMRNGQQTIPAERFQPGPAVRAEPVTDSLTGSVIGGRELRELKHPQNYVFIDLGRDKGVTPGDVFDIRRVPGPRVNAPDTIDELMASGQVVRVGERHSTVLLTGIISPDIPPGMKVVRVKRLPQQ
ncbi:MAG TPA: LysM peptidoglycan-binding domain-containing protein [Gemmatimonadales bacterium]|nr:LysM peptidoglycan-binding domain-containing protein [Gemmatimonadales bacterium]